MKKINVIILGIVSIGLLDVSAFPASLRNIDKGVSTSSDNRFGNQNGFNQNNNIQPGGYQNQTQVIGQRSIYIRRNFAPADLDVYLPLVHKAKAFDQLEKWYAQGKISWQGQLQVPFLQVGNTMFTPERLLTVDRVEAAFRSAYTNLMLYQTLVDKGILDQRGSLKGLPAATTQELKTENFNYLRAELLSKIQFGIDHKVLEGQLLSELTEFFTVNSQVLEVTKQETTRYSSGNSGNILSDIFNQFVGSTAGSFVFQDRVNVQKTNMMWFSNISIASFYPRFSVGYLPHPYFMGTDGVLGMNGFSQQTNLQATFMNQDPINYFGMEFGRNYLLSTNGENAGNYGRLSVSYWQLSEQNSKLGFGDISAGLGVVSNSFSAGFNLGLVYRNGLSISALGIKTGGEFSWYPIAPLSLFGSITSYSQPNFLKGESVWSLSDLTLGLGLHFAPVAVKLGYKSLSDIKGDVLFSGPFVGVNYQFL